jgi:hypothetical protein
MLAQQLFEVVRQGVVDPCLNAAVKHQPSAGLAEPVQIVPGTVVQIVLKHLVVPKTKRVFVAKVLTGGL